MTGVKERVILFARYIIVVIHSLIVISSPPTPRLFTGVASCTCHYWLWGVNIKMGGIEQKSLLKSVLR